MLIFLREKDLPQESQGRKLPRLAAAVQCFANEPGNLHLSRPRQVEKGVGMVAKFFQNSPASVAQRLVTSPPITRGTGSGLHFVARKIKFQEFSLSRIESEEFHLQMSPRL